MLPPCEINLEVYLVSVSGELDDEDIYENEIIRVFRCNAAKFWVKYG
jgi:hypothetical protein